MIELGVQRIENVGHEGARKEMIEFDLKDNPKEWCK
jgi:hypothetical protein